MFSLRAFIKTGLLGAVGIMADYQIILNAVGWLEKNVLLEEDLAEIQAALEAREQINIPKISNPEIPEDETTPEHDKGEHDNNNGADSHTVSDANSDNSGVDSDTVSDANSDNNGADSDAVSDANGDNSGVDSHTVSDEKE